MGTSLAAKRNASRGISARTLAFGNKTRKVRKRHHWKSATQTSTSRTLITLLTRRTNSPLMMYDGTAVLTGKRSHGQKRRPVGDGRELHACVSVCVWFGRKRTGKYSWILSVPLTYILQTFGESAVTDLVIWVTQGLQSGMAGLSHALLPTMQRKRLKLRGFGTRYACVNTARFTKVSKRNKFRYRVEDSPSEKVGDEEQDAAAWQMRAVRPPSCMTIGRLFTETSYKNSW